MRIRSIMLAVIASVLLLPLVADAQQTEQDYRYFSDDNGEMIITAYTGSDNEAIIPMQINGQPVTSIGDNAFKGNNHLVSVTIPEGIESIGMNAFRNCQSLKKVSLPSTLVTMGESAFNSCSSLESVRIPDGVTKIENYTFYRCLELKSATFPKTLTSIGSKAFAVTGLEQLELPEGTGSIGEMAFYGCRNLTKITLPNSISTMDKYAFFVCKNLSEVVLPSGLSMVPLGAFDKCPALSFAAVPMSIKRINDDAFSSGLIKPVSLKILGVQGSEAERFASRAGFAFGPVPATDSVVLLQDGKNAGGDILAIDLSSDVRSFQLEARTSPDTMWPGVEWTSSSPDVAAVDSLGTVTGLKKGKATITATAIDGSSKSVSVQVNIANLARSINIIGESVVSSKRAIVLQAVVLPETADNKNVRWSVSDSSLLAIDNKGEVTASNVDQRHEFTVTATAQDGSGVVATHNMTLYPLVSEIILLQGGNRIGENAGIILDLSSDQPTIQFDVNVIPGDALQAVTWKSSSPKTAIVSEEGIISGIKKGKATITATSADGSGKSASVIVNVASFAKEINITGDSEVTSGKTIKLKASVLPETTDNKKVTWSSSDENVARVNKNGEVTAKKVSEKMTVTITALAQDGSGVSASRQINVLPEAEEVSLSLDSQLLEPGASISIDLASGNTSVQLSAKVNPEDALQRVVWKSSDTRIATVDESGRVTGIKKGKVTITATTADGTRKRAKCSVEVQNSDH